MSNQQYDFKGKSIKCKTWNQAKHLAELAEEQGYNSWSFSRSEFQRGCKYFALDGMIYTLFLRTDQEVVTYSDFINSLPNEVLEVTGCEDCVFNIFHLTFEIPECKHPNNNGGSKQLVSFKEELNLMFAACPLKKSSLTIKLKSNDTTTSNA